MSHTKDIVTLIIVIFFFSSASASDEYAGGVWTKTTHVVFKITAVGIFEHSYNIRYRKRIDDPFAHRSFFYRTSSV